MLKNCIAFSFLLQMCCVFSQESSISIANAKYSGGGLAINDFNGDGIFDIILAGKIPGPRKAKAELFLGNKDGTYTYHTKVCEVDMAKGSELAALTADFNNDGFSDFIIATNTHGPREGRAYVFLNDGNSNFIYNGKTQSIPVAEKSGISGQVVDYNYDGAIDFILLAKIPGPRTARIYKFYNNGNGTFKLEKN